MDDAVDQMLKKVAARKQALARKKMAGLARIGDLRV